MVVNWIAKLALDREDLSSNPSKLFIREPASVKIISYSIIKKIIWILTAFAKMLK